MIRSVRVTQPCVPGHLAKHQHEQQEEDPGHLEKQNAAKAFEGPHEAAQTAGNIGSSAPRLHGGDASGRGSAHSGHGHRPRRSMICRPGKTLPGKLPRHP